MGGNAVGIEYEFDLLDRTRIFGLAAGCCDGRSSCRELDTGVFIRHSNNERG